MDEEKYEWEQEIKRDREEEMRQDAYEERIEIDRARRLHTEPESIQEWNEWQELASALEDFRTFCRQHDLDWQAEMKEM